MGTHQSRDSIVPSLDSVSVMSESFLGRSPDEWFWMLPPSVLAHHMTMVDQMFYGAIQPSEFLRKKWTIKERRRETAPNIVNLTHYFNLVRQQQSLIVTMVLVDLLNSLVDRLLDEYVGVRRDRDVAQSIASSTNGRVLYQRCHCTIPHVLLESVEYCTAHA